MIGLSVKNLFAYFILFIPPKIFFQPKKTLKYFGLDSVHRMNEENVTGSCLKRMLHLWPFCTGHWSWHWQWPIRISAVTIRGVHLLFAICCHCSCLLCNSMTRCRSHHFGGTMFVKSGMCTVTNKMSFAKNPCTSSFRMRMVEQHPRRMLCPQITCNLLCMLEACVDSLITVPLSTILQQGLPVWLLYLTVVPTFLWHHWVIANCCHLTSRHCIKPSHCAVTTTLHSLHAACAVGLLESLVFTHRSSQIMFTCVYTPSKFDVVFVVRYERTSTFQKNCVGYKSWLRGTLIRMEYMYMDITLFYVTLKEWDIAKNIFGDWM
jgi:hypothetical protein